MPTSLQRTVKPKILVADDEPNWLRVLSLYLRGRQCEVTTALDGHEAIHKIQQDRPDLIIADITMPGMDGYELCRHLRRDAATRTIPFIFLTAKSEKEDFRKGMKLGADDYLVKPFDDLELLDAVEMRLKKNEILKADFKKDIEGLNDFIHQAKGLEDLNRFISDEQKVAETLRRGAA